ncbi:MAG: trimethylamine methyltransferase family protein [Gammaproteobacteria bacterium]|nr:trimethylamine methyltransferase family protein [Gammaproteobacteria bacterium]
MSSRQGRGRGAGREARREARQRRPVSTAPFIERHIPYYEVLDDQALALIEHNADTVLEEIGIEFNDFPEALNLLQKAGASVAGERVRFPRGMCRSIVQASAPAEYTQHARNPERNVIIGGKRTVLVPAYGSPFVRDLDGGRRYATLEDFRNFVKLTYMSPGLHHSGGTVCEPVDIPVNKRHLDMVYSHIRYSDKPFMGSVTRPSRAEDTVSMAKILFGDDFVENNTVLTSLINANSPMTYDATMLGAATVYARHNQATMISPFLLAGAMSPVTVAGTATQILAEALAGMAYIQLVKPGAPVIFGTFSAAVSMQSGAPTFGTPEPSLILYVAAALARRLGVPFRSGGALCAAKIADAQAAYESANTLQTSALAGVNFMLHTAGWLEGGLVMGYEKFIIDADQANMIAVLLRGVDMSENGQGLDALREVGPGSHFFGAAHTRANFENAFYRSTIADNNRFEQWELEGSQDAAQRANGIWKSMLADYEAPALDPAVDEALLDYIARRKSELPDQDY